MKNNVRYYREQRNLTQSELASLIDVQVQTVWNIEHARSKPRPRTLRKLAEVLGVSLEQLFEEEEEQPASFVA